MSERRWTGVLICTVVISFLIIHYMNRYGYHHLAFKDCDIRFKYYESVDSSDVDFVAANNKLARCLCQSEMRLRDESTTKRIIQLYSKFGRVGYPDSTRNVTPVKLPLDSILKYNKAVFDTVIARD